MSEERSEEVQKSSLLPNANFYPSKDLDLNLRKAVDSFWGCPHRVNEVEIKKSKAYFSETLISYCVFTNPLGRPGLEVTDTVPACEQQGPVFLTLDNEPKTPSSLSGLSWRKPIVPFVVLRCLTAGAEFFLILSLHTSEYGIYVTCLLNKHAPSFLMNNHKFSPSFSSIYM